MTFTSALIVSALALAAPPDANPSQANSESIQVKHCLVSMIDRVRLSSSEAGPLTSFGMDKVTGLPIDQGSIVSKDDILGQLDDIEPQIKRDAALAELAVAEEQANGEFADVNVRASVKMAEVAKAEWDQAVEINKKSPGAVSETEVRRLKLTYERGVLQADVARMELNVAKLTLKAKEAAVRAAENEIRRRKLVAPIDAIVDQRLGDVGEWVQPGQPVMELVRIDKLRVEAFLSAAEVAPIEVVGRPVTIEITVKDPKSNKQKVEKFESKITFVSSQIVADGSFRVATDFENRKVGDDWAVRPGMVGNMTIKLVGSAGQTPLAAPGNKPASSRLTPVSNK